MARIDWLANPGESDFSYDYPTPVIGGMTGSKTYYGCYNIADNLPELNENCIVGYSMAMSGLPDSGEYFTSPEFTPYGVVRDGIATELYTDLGGSSGSLTVAGGVRLASIDNPLDYSCFVPIGDANNNFYTVSAATDGISLYLTGKTIGGVDHTYHLQKLMLNNQEFIEFLNTCFKSDPNNRAGIYSCTDRLRLPGNVGPLGGGILRTGVDGDYSYELTPYTELQTVLIPYDALEYLKLPARMPLLLALRLCNWLHNRTTDPGTINTEDGAYDLTDIPPFTTLEGASPYSGNCGIYGYTIDPTTSERLPMIVRKPGAKYFLPNVDEWFKAAFYKGGSTNAGYWETIYGINKLTEGTLPQTLDCPLPTNDIYASPLSCVDRYTFTPLRFNCDCAICSNESISLEGVGIGADPDGFTGPICFKAFATDDCESAEKCITISIPPRPPCIIDFKTRTLAALEGASGATNMIFTVIRGGWTNKRITSVDWVVTGTGSKPASPDDFVGGAYPSGSLVFASGESSKTITIQVQGDATVELTEEFLITLSNVTGNGSPRLGFFPTAIGQILKDEPEIRFDSDESAQETGSPTGLLQNNFITFNVLKIGGPGIVCSIDWAISADGADPVSADDFALNAFSSGTLTFAPGETSKPITIEIQDDLVQESNETLKIILSNPIGGSLGSPSTAYGTIIDNDDPEKSNFIRHKSTTMIRLAEGDTGVTNFDFEIIRDNVTGVKPEISVDWAVAGSALFNATAASSSDFIASPGPGVYPSGTVTFAENETSKTVTIETVTNTIVDLNRGFRLTLSNVNGGVLMQPATRTAFIENDDVPPPPPPRTPACQLADISCGSFDISGAKIVAIYDHDSSGNELCSPVDCTGVGSCFGICGQGSHVCDLAVFDFVLEGQIIGQINLNNASSPGTPIPGANPYSRISTLYVPQLNPTQIPPDGIYTFSTTCALLGCHFGIMWLKIYDTKDNLIFCDCVENDQLIAAALCTGKTAEPEPPCGNA